MPKTRSLALAAALALAVLLVGAAAAVAAPSDGVQLGRGLKADAGLAHATRHLLQDKPAAAPAAPAPAPAKDAAAAPKEAKKDDAPKEYKWNPWQGPIVAATILAAILIMSADLVAPDLVFAGMACFFCAARIIDVKQLAAGFANTVRRKKREERGEGGRATSTSASLSLSLSPPPSHRLLTRPISFPPSLFPFIF